MNFSKLIAVSGKSGLYNVVANRRDGLIIEDLDGTNKEFVSARLHQFTPLESIGIYVDAPNETIALKDVFEKMNEQYETIQPASDKASAEEHRAYFTKILPEHDAERVKISDIRKLCKWFLFLKSKQSL